MTPKNLLIECFEPGIRVIKVNRPEALNALNTETLLEFKEVLKRIADDSEVRVVILTGSGDKSFIAGADIVEMKDKSTSQAVEFSRQGHEVTKLLQYMTKPVIAAVNGFALGGGTEMAIACDFIYASENAVFGQPEVGLGVIPGFGGTARLGLFVGWPMAKDLIYSGRKIDAAEALRIGLVNGVYSQEELLPKVLDLAAKISRNSKGAVMESKSLLNDFSESNGMDQKLDAEAIAFGKLFGSHDQKEGMTAFAERRKPVFKGLRT